MLNYFEKIQNLRNNLRVVLLILTIATVVSVVALAAFKFNPGRDIRDGDRLAVVGSFEDTELEARLDELQIEFYDSERVSQTEVVFYSRFVSAEQAANLGEALGEGVEVELSDYFTQRISNPLERIYVASGVGALIVFLALALVLRGKGLNRGQILSLYVSLSMSVALSLLVFAGLYAIKGEFVVMNRWVFATALMAASLLGLHLVAAIWNVAEELETEGSQNLARVWHMHMDKHIGEYCMLWVGYVIASMAIGLSMSGDPMVGVLGVIDQTIVVAFMWYFATHHIIAGVENIRQNSSVFKKFFNKKWK